MVQFWVHYLSLENGLLNLVPCLVSEKSEECFIRIEIMIFIKLIKYPYDTI